LLSKEYFEKHRYGCGSNNHEGSEDYSLQQRLILLAPRTDLFFKHVVAEQAKQDKYQDHRNNDDNIRFGIKVHTIILNWLDAVQNTAGPTGNKPVISGW
jgi:hypothetical protein